MKKIVSIISAIAMAASFCAPVFADSNSAEMKTVLQSVKERVEIPAECTEFSSTSSSEYGTTAYEFSWSNKDSDEYRNVRVSALSDGTVIGYSTSLERNNGEPQIPNLTEEDAKTIAQDFIKKINPDFPYEVRLEENGTNVLYGGGYSFGLRIYVNDIVISDSYGSINVNGESGKIRNYRLDYVPVEFPSVDNAISVEEAKKAYSEKLGLQLVYKTYTDNDGKEQAYPAYVQKVYDNTYINALTGDTVTLNEEIYADRNMASGAMKAEMSTADDAGLSPQEIEELEKIDGLMSKADAEKQLRANKTLDIPSGMETSHISLYKTYEGENYIYNVSFDNNDEHIYASVNAKTGEIQSYNRYGKDLDSEMAQNDKAFKALAGNKADEYEYDEEGKAYQRYVNGIPVDGDRASLSYSNGTLTSYYITHTEVEFPALDNVVSAADAEKTMFEKNGYEMSYALSVGKKEIKAIPVYIHSYININAFTGKVVDYNNEEPSTDGGRLEYSDINNHYANEIIKTLASYGIGFEGGEFKPDEKITQKDYISLLSSISSGPVVIMRDNASQYDSTYRNAIRQDIISSDERDDDAIVTRENAAIYLIRAIGAESYAKYDDIYVRPFKDVTSNKGYIALLSAMGVVSGNEEGNFTPQREITRAESAVMIYKYLTRQ